FTPEYYERMRRPEGVSWWNAGMRDIAAVLLEQADLPPGTLDLVILKAISLGDVHGYGVLLRIERISKGAILVQQGALYPALYRLEHQGLIESEWGTSENNRRAKYYRLTALGQRRFGEERASWSRLAQAMTLALTATPREA
ncbi:MAG: PadR family transcriptional regulator, partial [Gemmatimonadota bacterium]